MTEALPAVDVDTLESGAIDLETFDHEAHVYAAWLYLGRYDVDEALLRFGRALSRLASRAGAADKYHATITGFFMLLVAERMQPGQGWVGFRDDNSDLFGEARSLLDHHYSSDRLASPLARAQFVLPDRVPTAP